MNTSDFENKLTEELSDIAPNRLNALLDACGERERAPRAVEMPCRPRRRLPRILAAAAIFVLLLGGALGYRALDADRCVVTVDVNPSVSLTVNRFNRVKEVTPLNADAEALLDGVDLKGTDVHRALETLTSELIEQEHLGGGKNAMLVSVENASFERAAALCEKVVSAVKNISKTYQFSPAVLYQHISGKTELQTQAETLNVSVGKAVVADAVAAYLEGCPLERLSTLSIQDLLFLADIQDVTMEDTCLFGSVDCHSYCSGDEAAKVALNHAGLTGADVSEVAVSFDSRDGELVYLIAFSNEGYTYHYVVDAWGGTILDSERTGEGPVAAPVQSDPGTVAPVQSDPDTAAQPETPPVNRIDPMDALKRVLERVHHTLKEIQNPSIQMVWIENTPYYRISFEIDGREHQFYVNANADGVF